MTRRPFNYVPFVLCTTGILVCLLAGCRKEAEKPEIPASSPESYMNDKGFRRDLEERRRERVDLTKARSRLVAKLEKMVDAKRAEMPGADDAAVKAALEKDVEWNGLIKRVEDLNTAIGESRQRALKTVRTRLAPEQQGKGKKEISK